MWKRPDALGNTKKANEEQDELVALEFLYSATVVVL